MVVLSSRSSLAPVRVASLASRLFANSCALPRSLGYVTPEKTVVYDESEVLDIDTVSIDGGVLLKMLSFSLDPYLRHKMIEKEQRPYERIVSPPRSAHGRYT